MDPKDYRKKGGREHTVELSRTAQNLAIRMAEAQPSTHCLVVMGGMDVGAVYRLTTPTVVAGRDPECDVPLGDDGISRRHASFTIEGGRCFVEDLNSTNGVFLNGSRIGRAELQDGDKILLGRFTILKYEKQDDLEIEYQRRVHESLSLDGLTGILNRRALEQRISSEWSFATRHGTSLSVLMLDVDHFKKVNDTYGHAAGDVVLKAVAGAVAEAIRGEDFAGRYGGEEFVVVARGIGQVGAMMLARRLRAVVEGLRIEHGGEAVPVTVSIGVATAAGSYGDTAATLLKLADERLYLAKRAGRNREVGEEQPDS